MSRTPPEKSRPPESGKQTERERRRAEALRANLRRRKTQSRDRKQAEGDEPPAS